MRRTIIILILVAICASANCQSSQDRNAVREGNKHYKKARYEEAAAAYLKGSDSTYYKKHYNLGNSLYRQKNYSEAANHFAKAAQCPNVNAKDASRILHNMGNCHLQCGLQDRENGMEHFQKAVQSYQQALMVDPKNEDTRYNLSYAKKLLQQAQQQQQQNGGQNDQNKDQQDQKNQNGNNQDKQDQQKQQQNQNGQQDQNKDQQQQQKQQQNGQQGNQKQDHTGKDQKRKDAERMLEAVRNNEKNTMKENQKKVEVGRVSGIDKDW